MPKPRQNRAITVFFTILRGTRILIGLATIIGIVLLLSWLMGKSGGN